MLNFFFFSLWVLHVFLLDTKLLGNFNEIEKTASNDTEIFQNEVAIFWNKITFKKEDIKSFSTKKNLVLVTNQNASGSFLLSLLMKLYMIAQTVLAWWRVWPFYFIYSHISIILCILWRVYSLYTQKTQIFSEQFCIKGFFFKLRKCTEERVKKVCLKKWETEDRVDQVTYI